MPSEQADRIEAAVEKLEDVAESLTRSIQGSEQEGNPGLLRRMLSVEKKVSYLRWTMPAALLTGTTVTGLLLRFLPI